MDRYSFDINKLNNKITEQQKKVYKLADVSDRIEKVAFDIVRFRENEDTTQLWKIEESADGPVIVAVYEDASLKAEASLKNRDWNAISDKQSNVNVFYKGDPIAKISASKMGIPSDEVPLLCRWLPEKLANDTSFRKNLIKDINKDVRDLILSKYPELQG